MKAVQASIKYFAVPRPAPTGNATINLTGSPVGTAYVAIAANGEIRSQAEIKGMQLRITRSEAPDAGQPSA